MNRYNRNSKLLMGLGLAHDGGPAPLRLRANGRTGTEHYSARQRRDTRPAAADWLPGQ